MKKATKRAPRKNPSKVKRAPKKAFNTGLVGDAGDFPCDRCKKVIEHSGKWKPGMAAAGWYARAGWAFTFNDDENAVCDACIHADPRYQERYGKTPAAPAVEFTPKESRFIQEYIIDLNGAAAARRSGYSEATAKSIACELLAKPHIQEAISAAMLERAWRTQITADRVLTGIADLAYYDIAELFADDGSLKPIHEIPQRMRMAIAGVEVEELWEGKGESREHVGTLHKVKLVDRKGSLELLGRHLKLFTDKVEHSGAVTLEDLLTASREAK